MAFNFLTRFAAGWEESQLGDLTGHDDAVDNCGGASGALVMMAYGYPDIEPQAWKDYEYGTYPTYHGGMTLESLADFVSKKFSSPPTTSIEDHSGQVAAAVDSYGKQGFPTIGWFYCDTQARIVPYWSSISHFSPIVAFDGNIFTVKNVWNGAVNNFNAAQLNASSVGRIMVFKRSLFGMTVEDLVRTWFWIAVGHDPSSADLQNWVANVKPDNGPALFAQILALPEARAHWNTIIGTGSSGPAGPKGDPGPQGPAGPTGPSVDLSGIQASFNNVALKGHEHVVSGTAK